jgi:hypothetical protein
LLTTCWHRSNENEQDKALNEAGNTATLAKASDDSFSLLWLRDADSRLSFQSVTTDGLSRLSQVFPFDGKIIDSKPYGAAVKDTWKKLKTRRHNDGEQPPPTVTRTSDLSLSMPAGDHTPCRSIVMIVKYDFESRRPNEMSCCKVGEILVSSAISTMDDDWVLAHPVSRLGLSGFVPVPFMSVAARSRASCETTKEEILQEMRECGITGVAEWIKQKRRNRESATLV